MLSVVVQLPHLHPKQHPIFGVPLSGERVAVLLPRGRYPWSVCFNLTQNDRSTMEHKSSFIHYMYRITCSVLVFLYYRSKREVVSFISLFFPSHMRMLVWVVCLCVCGQSWSKLQVTKYTEETGQNTLRCNSSRTVTANGIDDSCMLLPHLNNKHLNSIFKTERGYTSYLNSDSVRTN